MAGSHQTKPPLNIQRRRKKCETNYVSFSVFSFCRYLFQNSRLPTMVNTAACMKAMVMVAALMVTFAQTRTIPELVSARRRVTMQLQGMAGVVRMASGGIRDGATAGRGDAVVAGVIMVIMAVAGVVDITAAAGMDIMAVDMAVDMAVAITADITKRS